MNTTPPGDPPSWPGNVYTTEREDLIDLRTTASAWHAMDQVETAYHTAPWASWRRAKMERDARDDRYLPDASSESPFDYPMCCVVLQWHYASRVNESYPVRAARVVVWMECNETASGRGS